MSRNAALAAALTAAPFLWSLAPLIRPDLTQLTPPMFAGRVLAVSWGAAVLFFSSGALAAMAVQARAGAALTVLAVLPGLFAFLAVPDASDNSLLLLAAAFLGLLMTEFSLTRAGLIPPAWFRFRLAVTLAACLALLLPLF